jgi:O-antigen/teichoic acid export membrane protein
MSISNSTEAQYRETEIVEVTISCERLTNGRLLLRNTSLNFIGQAGPLIIAIISIPILIKELGIDRFGVLTIAWMMIGYFSLFDLGLGRTLTKFVAERLGIGQEDRIPALIWTSLLLIFIFGIVGMVLAILLSPWLANYVLNIPMGLRTESLNAFYLLALCIPVAITTSGLKGILEAKQHFGFINVMSITMGGFSFLAPLLVMFFSKSLLAIVAVLLAGRLFVMVLYLIFCLYVIPALRHGFVFERAVVAPLLRFGGWVTVSNIVSPVMAYLDRFLVATIISVAAVAYYITPYSVITKLLIIPIAIVSVLFPAFTTSFTHDHNRTTLLFIRGIKYVFLIMFPMALVIVSFARQGIDIWLGKEFSENSARVLQLLTIGVFINGLSQIPFYLIQSADRPDLTAKLHLIELPFYLASVWWMTQTFGIEGTAIVWSVRVLVDALFLFKIARSLLPRGSFGFQHAEFPSVLALLVLVLGMVTNNLTINAEFVVFMMSLFICTSWLFFLDNVERSIIHTYIKRGLGFIQRKFNA